MPPSLGGILNPVLGPRMAKGPLFPPGLVQISNSNEAEIPRPNADIISSLPNSHEAVMESLGSMSSADLVGVCNEALVPKEMDEVKTFSGSSLQYSELQPADGDPTGCREESADEKPCSDSLVGEDVSFEHPEVEAVALIVDVHDAGSLPGPPASSFVYHALGQYAEVDPVITPDSILRISRKYGLDCAGQVGCESTCPCASLEVDHVDSALVTPLVKPAPTKFRTVEEIVEMNHKDWKRAKARRRRESKRSNNSSGACARS